MYVSKSQKKPRTSVVDSNRISRATYPYVKRAFDIVVAGAGIVLLSPLLMAVLIAQTVIHGWPPFFTQRRPGLRGKIFRLVKFRTMTNERDECGELLPDDQRLTPFGRFLRSTSIDELPELINVLRGDMSLVGPRPLLEHYLPLYSEEQYRRHESPPGITGWAQINGRNAVSWDQKFAMDVWYVQNASFSLDLEILARTVLQVLRRDGITGEGQATVAYFQGSDRDPAP